MLAKITLVVEEPLHPGELWVAHVVEIADVVGRGMSRNEAVRALRDGLQAAKDNMADPNKAMEGIEHALPSESSKLHSMQIVWKSRLKLFSSATSE